MKILDYLSHDRVIINLKKKNKKEVIEELVGCMIASGVEGEASEITKALMEREKTGSTGIGSGVAIPHAKTEQVKSLGVVYAFSPGGVEYDSVDGRPANFFFLIASPPAESAVQLRLLARISRLMGNRLLRNDLKGSDSPQKVIDVISRYD